MTEPKFKKGDVVQVRARPEAVGQVMATLYVGDRIGDRLFYRVYFPGAQSRHLPEATIEHASVIDKVAALQPGWGGRPLDWRTP